ncbi:NepR family anti-sigma factor [Loktanella sp. DJP18]|uniref:NepR family anti-sigma factor n=1 Tax=Loktanella sp. DJP18 TaxID=3409788 RepID=UPI003BB72B75
MSNETPSDRARQQIDANLKRVFREQEQADLPDRLKDLLARLKASEQPDQGEKP